MARRRTAYTLRSDGKYSPGERKIFAILSRVPVSTISIAEARWQNGDAPVNSRHVIIGAIRSLQRKIEANREPFRIAGTRRLGPKPMSFWLEPRR